jgi:squalene-hopene/tetraprenyl-beta-curcumene cyclase
MFKYVAFAALAFLPLIASAGEPQLSPDAFTPPGDNRQDEPLAGEFSLDRAVRFLDAASLDWQKERNCMTCHTNYAYLMARPFVSADGPAHAAVRQYAEELVSKRWQERGPRWDAEVVATAASLAVNDARTTGKLHPLTRTALDRMWTVQREDGGFDWIKCNWPPMEIDDHYGATLAAVAVGTAPQDYQLTEPAKKGAEGIRRYLKENPSPTLHHRAMVLWASMRLDGLMSDEERQACVADLLKQRHDDGGWGLANLGNWERADGSPQNTEVSDGYGTGFVLFVLRQAGVPADDEHVARGIEWLKRNQRQSGRWFTRSMNKDNKHYITHAGTAFAVMALAECGEK